MSRKYPSGHAPHRDSGGGRPSYDPINKTVLNFAVPSNDQGFSEQRLNRIARIAPHYQGLKKKQMPRIPKEQLGSLMFELKEEGNAHFKDKTYHEAFEHYSCALMVGKIVENHPDLDVDKELLSTVFSNKAACCNKMDTPKECIENCNYAIYLNENNIKAYYRKASAQKTLKQYDDAFTTAMKGIAVGEKMGKKIDDFRDLIREIESHMNPSTESSYGNVLPGVTGQSDRSLFSGYADPLSGTNYMSESSGPGPVGSRLNSYMQNQTEGDVPVASVSVGDIKVSKVSDVDETWLAGTNVNLEKPNPSKAKNGKGKNKGGKDKKNSKSNAYSGKFQYLQMLSSSDSSDQNSEDSEEDVLSQPTMNPSLTSGYSSQRASHTATPLSDFGYGSEDSAALMQAKIGRTQGMVSDYKGLDDFGLPPGMVLGSPEAEQHVSKPPPLMQQMVQETKAPQAYNPHLAVGHQRQQHHPANFPPKPNIPAPPLVYPFDLKYDFRMACQICYEKFSSPANAYRYKNMFPHNCQHDILLVKKKDTEDTECDWSRIRPRNKKITFTGRYRLCDQFPNGESCRVPELQCCFAHNHEEIHLWILDRNDEIDIENFIEIHRAHYNKVGEAMKLYKIQVQQIKSNQYPGNIMQQSVKHQHPSIPRKGLLGDAPGDGRQILSSTANQGSGKITMISHKPNSTTPNGSRTGQILDFPLRNTHDYKLSCEECLRETMEPGVYALTDVNHSCNETILIVQRKGERYWTKIRERKNHRTFIGDYIMCRNFAKYPPNPCTVGEDLCSFSHNQEEKYLWTLEKDTDFNLQEFVLQHRANPNKGLDVEELFSRHPGLFKYICSVCYYGKPPRISVESKGGLMCSVAGHDWEEHKLLIHHASNGMITAIEERPFTHDGAFFLPCHKMQYCVKRSLGECKFSHSIVEKDVWLVERDSKIDRDTLVEKSSKFQPANGIPMAPPVATKVKDPTAVNMASPSSNFMPFEEKGPEPCPFRIIEVCELCWNKGAKSTQNGTKDRCTGSGMGHTFSINKMCLLVPQNKVIRAVPKKIPKAGYIMCTHVKAKRKCEYFKNRGGSCHYAHSQEELDVWTWQAKNNVLSAEALIAESKKSHDSAMQSKKIEKGESVINVKPSTGPQLKTTAPPTTGYMDLSLNAYYCHYCTVSCNSQKQWDQHCASSKHMFNLESDKEHQWNYRQPPWGVPSGSYRLCKKHQEGKCRYTGSSNMCKFAHSQEELDEWRERWEWRQMKREIAKKEKVYSYMENILDDYENSTCGSTVMIEEKDGIVISCPTELVLYRQDKTSSVNWVFDVQVTNGKPLEKVALLQNKDRLHFAIQTRDAQDKNCQIATGDSFLTTSDQGIQMYRVEISFEGGMFGSFLQWVAFDFGERPILVRKLNIELGHYHIQEKVKTLREKLSFDRWTSANREIVYFSPEGPRINTFNAELQKLYKPPTSADTIVTQESLSVELNVHNYIHKMHKHLQIEELTRHQIIASFNLKTSLECLDKIIQESALICPRQGELFAKVPLNDQLSDDTNAGNLILTSVNNVLIAPQNTPDRRVYEAIFVAKENFDYDGRGKDYIYLCLSPSCNMALGLKPGLVIDVEIQFQMNRQTFCQMHYALDSLEDNGKVFPDYNKMQSLWNEKHPFDIKSDVLNEDQMKIIKHVLADRTGYIPPLIVYGPFGTGKTETLAQAAMVLVREKPNVKILICSHSNSAADLYITKHFDAFKKEFPELKMLRVYFEERRIVTVQKTIQQYCLLSEGSHTFRMPTREDIMNNQIIIATLGTSLLLTKLGIKGCFSHMFIDEAAQALECETIMPITLASENTCVVLAGDYMQMSPKVYSPENQRQHMNCSLLERLYKHYEAISHDVGSQNKLNVLLSTNYRTKMEILRFISAVFYGGPEKLISKSQQATCTDIVPLTFYSAQGIEVQDSDSTSYYNTAEIEEVTEGVYQLYSNWPQEWGPRRADQIGVVTPYKDQVSKIRLFLRRKKKELRDVVVERVMNVQGKEFRALFISAVRTVHLAETKPNMPSEATECDGEVGDYGFLSDQKLLNTALTRAQSFVGVVGDPVALCAIGECMTIWRTFLKHCQNMKSIFPRSVTMDNVKSQVIQLTQSSYGSNLVQLADLTQEASENDTPMQSQGQAASNAPQITPQITPAIINTSPVHQFTPFGQNQMSFSSAAGPYQNLATPLNQFSVSMPSTTAAPGIGLPKFSGLSLADTQPLAPRLTLSALPQTNSSSAANGLSLSSMLASDPRLELHSFIQQPTAVVEDEFLVDTVGQGGFFEEFSRNDSVKLSLVINQLATEAHREQQQLAMKSLAMSHLMPEPFNPNKINIREWNRLLVVSFSGKDKDGGILGGMGDGQYEAFTVYTVPQLQGLLAQNSDVHHRCILHCRKSGQYYAKVLAGKYAGQHIGIESRFHCGQAFNNDEVVVTVIESDVEDTGNDSHLHGKVIGVLNRAIDPSNKIFLCVIEQENAGMMVPVNKDFPPIYNLQAENKVEKSKKGQVCVYSFTASGLIKFHHFEPVDLTKPSEKLFLVKYLDWDDKFFYPTGVVVGVLPPGTNIENAIKILDLEYDIKHTFDEETKDEIQHLYPEGYGLPSAGLELRTDLREKVIFTIDPPNTKSFENAFSVEPMADQMYLVGIHSADVTYFVANGGLVDKEARQRGDTYCPHSYSPIQILPERLSTDLCSLKPNVDRLTVSVFLTVNQEGDVVNVELRRSIIQSKHCLKYPEVETIIKDSAPDIPLDLRVGLLILSKLSIFWSQKRIGNENRCPFKDPVGKNFPNAHLLVEEVKATTNHYVALLLHQQYPECTPLMVQSSPDGRELQKWCDRHGNEAQYSVALRKPFLPKGGVCLCKAECTCVPSKIGGVINIQREVWHRIREALTVSPVRIEEIKTILLNSKLHPHLAMAQLELEEIQDQEGYLCSGTTDPALYEFYEMNVTNFTHFTSPISRYMDLVVQHQITAAMEGKPCPYSQKEVISIASSCTSAIHRSTEHEQDARLLNLSEKLQNNPLTLYPMVKTIDSSSIKLYFPNIEGMPASGCTIQFNVLGLADVPVVNMDANRATLFWQARVYDAANYETSRIGEELVMLDADSHVVKIPKELWQMLMEGTLTDSVQKMEEIVPQINQLVTADSYPRPGMDVSCAGRVANFGTVLCGGSVTAVQLVRGLSSEGQLAPKIQLLSLSPTIDICIEHREDALKCFAEPCRIHASKQRYTDITEYQNAWRPVVSIEAVKKAALSSKAITIHKVHIQWEERRQHLQGEFSLPQAFCVMKQIEFNSQSKLGDCLCVRYAGIKPKTPVGFGELELYRAGKEDNGFKWVGHCKVTKVNKTAEAVTVTFTLHQSTVPFPAELLQTNLNLATIELQPYEDLERKMLATINDLSKGHISDLPKNIALGQTPATLGENHNRMVDMLSKMDTPFHWKPNMLQESTIHTALSKPYTLVQGPPGSGKTLLAIRLAYLFTQINKVLTLEKTKNGIKPRVLMCAPTEKALDGITGLMKSLGDSCPKIVRVYSKETVENDFPFPVGQTTKLANTLTETVAPEHADVALHYKIREGITPLAQQIAFMEQKFKQMTPSSITESELKTYLDIISKAEVEELKNAEVVLCTCATSLSPSIAVANNVQELIIDGANQITEPETMIPIVNCRPEQVVLFGDLHQLKPTVLSDKARILGLQCSLFERCNKNAVQLHTQYRMHEGIAEFPSKFFYESRLQCGKEEQLKPSQQKFWPHGKNKPLSFIHVAGKTESQFLPTPFGGEVSKMNAAEAAQAVRIATHLLRRYYVKAPDMAVLTQYASQCSEIQQQLKHKGCEGVEVSTVTNSRGKEWDYVVFSCVTSLPKVSIEKNPSKAWQKKYMGLISDNNEMNVALTRARKGLIIIGNQHLLRCVPMWQKLLDFYQSHNKISTVEEFMAK